MAKRENIRKAKEIIASHRANAVSTFEAHTAEIKEKIPEIGRIDALLSSTGVRIMGEALNHSLDQTKLDEIHAEYDNLKVRKKSLLLANGYPDDYLDIKYHCQKCSDTGYTGIEMCSCLKREIVMAGLESSGLSSLIRTQTFNTFSLDFYENNDKIKMGENLEKLKRFAYEFDSSKNNGSFLFMGNTGLGKTHLSTSVAAEILKKGCDVVYETALQMMNDYETVRFSSYNSEAELPDLTRYTESDLLIVDDLGTEMSTQYTVSCLYNIINTRINRGLSTIISTNLSQAELRNRYSDRVTSRLFGEYLPLVFCGRDIRAQKIAKGLV